MEMVSGRLLDARVAEVVMGARVEEGWVIEKVEIPCPDQTPQCQIHHRGIVRKCPPPYSSEIAEAWRVVERLREWDFEIKRSEGTWRVSCTRAQESFSAQGSVEESICKVALAALLGQGWD